MTKKLIITLCDATTGEIFSSNKNTRFLPDDRIREVVNQWIDSYFRGLSLGKEICITIAVKNKAKETIDDLFVNVPESSLSPVVDSINTPY